MAFLNPEDADIVVNPGWLAISENTITATNQDRNADAFIGFDMGVGFFSGFPDTPINFYCEVTAEGGAGGDLIPLSIANVIKDHIDIELDGDNAFSVFIQQTASKLILLLSFSPAIDVDVSIIQYVIGTRFFFSEYRSADRTTVLLELYSTEARNPIDLLDTMIVDTVVEDYRIIYQSQNQNTGQVNKILSGVFGDWESDLFDEGVAINPLRSAMFGERGVLAA